MDYDFQKEEDVKEFLEKLGVEYRFSCFSEKRPDSCHLLGEYFETIKTDYEKAMKVFKNNCDEYKFARSCNQKYVKAILFHRQNGMEMLLRGCDLNNQHACYYASAVYITGREEYNIPSDMEKAFKYADRGCELGSIHACGNLSMVRTHLTTNTFPQ
ncbi:hypothetical protein HAZT_HAZT001829 [Hyalella azteca]|uniref:Uncharacterized protein n=1 Tax=Hyalella azteca TaxID=294128 RepID=A0A6A0GNY5_HYAAZ|nr:hypothetical protein HAZT_HAZT001829 [Hyalella azteca]